MIVHYAVASMLSEPLKAHTGGMPPAHTADTLDHSITGNGTFPTQTWCSLVALRGRGSFLIIIQALLAEVVIAAVFRGELTFLTFLHSSVVGSGGCVDMAMATILCDGRILLQASHLLCCV